MVWGDSCTEVSGTAKVGTDEQELHTEAWMRDELAQLSEVQRIQTLIDVDAAAIDLKG